MDDETQVAEIEKILSKVLKNYTASCDNPCCGFFMELMKMNPNAKVILTVRDTPGTGLISFAWIANSNYSTMWASLSVRLF